MPLRTDIDRTVRAAALAVLSCGLPLVSGAVCQNAPQAGGRAKPALQSVKQANLPEFEVAPVKTANGTATWYDVAPNSLPIRRAAPGELTAAHDTLPLGAYVRVTSKQTALSVIVRITDRGVRKRGAIDLCKEAAEKIGLVGRGVVKVQMDLLKPKTGSIANATPKDAQATPDTSPAIAPALIPKDAILPPAPSP